MSISTWFSGVAFFSATFAGGLASWLYAKRHEAPFYRGLAVLWGLISLVHVVNGWGLLDDVHGLLWRRLSLAIELCLPSALFYAGLGFLSTSEQLETRNRVWIARLIGLAGLLAAGLAMTDYVLISIPMEEGGAIIRLAPWGHVTYAFIVITMALALAQFEVVLRSSSELTRYRLKLILIGLGGLGGYQIYQASHMLMLSIWRTEHVLLFSIVSVISLGVLTLGIARSRFKELLGNAYVSQQALFGSVTFIVIGFYLFVVGVIGEGLRRMNQPLGPEVSVVVVFGALVVLAVVVLSKTSRSEIRRFLTRNFYRSKYDYRTEWLRVTESFQSSTTKDAIFDCLLDILVKTFSTTTIAIWAFREADRRYCHARPVVSKMPTVELTHPVIRQLVDKDAPVMMSEMSGCTADTTDPLVHMGAELCFPIRIQDQLVAFVVLGKQPRGEPYGTDDCDLLHGICHHVGALLSHASLAEERQAAAELEALHRFSVFCLHDLKNLAARLSLVAQNAEHHGHDPAFQKSALTTVADTAKKMTGLMTKLSVKSFSPTAVGQIGALDLSSLIEEVVAPLRQDSLVRVHVGGDPVPSVWVVREQIQQVLLNVVLNARQAIAERGDISIRLARSNNSAVITIEDTGRGVPPDRLEGLFRPSQSSRPGGLGIGLYQCKSMIEAHGGIICLRSEEGTGTQVTIELPLAPMAEQPEVVVARKTQKVSRKT